MMEVFFIEHFKEKMTQRREEKGKEAKNEK